jgi:hypothetical protein
VNPITYDLRILGGGVPPDRTAGNPSFDSSELARRSMGDAREVAERVNLIATQPCSEPSSSGYALADPGTKYLILQLEIAEQIKIDMSAPSGLARLAVVHLRRISG